MLMAASYLLFINNIIRENEVLGFIFLHRTIHRYKIELIVEIEQQNRHIGI